MQIPVKQHIHSTRAACQSVSNRINRALLSLLLKQHSIDDQSRAPKGLVLYLLLSSTEEDVRKKKYILTDSSNRQFLSAEKGQLGGHKKLRKYGRFNCPSALRAIRKGQYIRHRVFFADEETAIQAGYTPCGNCMKEQYKIWKKSIVQSQKYY